MPEIDTWHDPGSPLRIEYSREAMEQIRKRAMDGAKALPRTGLAVGGLLLGEREGARVRILDSAELPCSHAFGPSLLLTPHEKAKGRELVETIGNLQVIGWYCSRTHGELELTDADLTLYRELFPAQWQITLLLRAGGEGPVRAAFFFSSQTGELAKGAERDLAEWIPGQEQPAFEEPDHWDVPGFAREQAEPPRRFRKLSWILTAIAALGVGAAAFEIQNAWLMEPPAQTAPPAQIP